MTARVLCLLVLPVVLALPRLSRAGKTDLSGPAGSEAFGTSVTGLPNGNIVVTDPGYDAPGPVTDVGAVYLYSPSGALLSTLTGSTAGDQVGSQGVTVLSNGHYVVCSSLWGDGTAFYVGAVTWCHGGNGLSGVVSAVNSLVGASSGDAIGNYGVTALSDGNYVVSSAGWDNGFESDAGAVTWGSGASGTSGVVSATNSLVGSTAWDQVGSDGITPLSNGHYLVTSLNWSTTTAGFVGAVTWCHGTTGTSGAVSAANSLVGSTTSDSVGSGGITLLSNGHYVVRSSSWDHGTTIDAGAVTWGNGASGTSGVVSSTNSLVGTTAGDQLGNGGVMGLSNGNYVVSSFLWDRDALVDAGAVTWASGTGGISGTITAVNSLVGSTASDSVGNGGVTALSNGNYVVSSFFWDNGAVGDTGAATWGNGVTGITGAVSTANSLVGSAPSDNVGSGGVAPLSNGNYVVSSRFWNNGSAAAAGAVTWANGVTGTTGIVSSANSLVGSKTNDQVSSGGLTPLTNGHYVARSPVWDNGAVANAGAGTWCNGNTGTNGVVSDANSLVGSKANDSVSSGGVMPLSNGNYVVSSASWDNGAVTNAGAVSWGNGVGGTSGAVSDANSLVGSKAGDSVGGGGVMTLSNGNYVVSSRFWDNGAVVDAGAATWGSGVTGIRGAVTGSNSLVGSMTGDSVGNGGTVALSNGNYVVSSPNWDNGAAGNTGAVTWGVGSTGINGVVSSSNSLVGSAAGDNVGGGGVAVLSGGNYAVSSPNWDNGPAADAGAITLGVGNAGTTAGPVLASNSVQATAASGGGNLVFSYDPSREQLAVGRRASNTVTLFTYTDPDIAVEQPAGADLPDGGAVNFGSVSTTGSAVRTFTVLNEGPVSLSGLALSKDGTHAGSFAVGVLGATSLAPGESTTFTVTFSSNTPGMHAAALHLASNDPDEHPYDITLNANAVTPPANDSLANRIDLGSAGTVNTAGNNIVASMEAGEADFGDVAGASVWYEWAAPVTGWVTLHTVGSELDTVLALYTGSGSDPAALTQVGFNDTSSRQEELGGEETNPSRLVFQAQASTSYKIAVMGYASADGVSEGAFELHVAAEATPPVRVAGVTLSPEPADITSAPQTVNVQVSVDSNAPLLPGASDSFFATFVRGDMSDSGILVPFGAGSMTSGTSTSGTYGANMTVPRYVPGGDWAMSLVHFATGSTINWTPPGADLVEDHYLIPAPVDARLSVINSGAVDSTGPALVSITGFPASVTVTAGAVSFEVDVTVTDALAGLQAENGYLGLLRADTGMEIGELTAANRISGNAQNGTYRVTVTIPQNTSSGTYYPEVGLTDTAFNQRSFSDFPDDEVQGYDPIPPVESVLSLQVIGVTALPEIVVEDSANVPLVDGSGSVSFGSKQVGGSTVLSRAFTVRNTGTGDLTSLALSFTGTHSGDFAAGSLSATTLAPAQAMTFTVTFDPVEAGVCSATLRIASNDGDENPFDIALGGTGLTQGEAWRQQYFGSISNSGNGADGADPDFDGIANLGERAFGLHPMQNSAGGLPQGQRSGGSFTMSFSEPAGVSGIIYDAEWSATLAPGTWSAVTDSGIPPQHTFSVPVGTNERLFMRLKVTEDP